MVGWHHWLHGHEFEQALGVGDGQGGLAYYSSWSRKESATTEQLNRTELCYVFAGCIGFDKSERKEISPTNEINYMEKKVEMGTCKPFLFFGLLFVCLFVFACHFWSKANKSSQSPWARLWADTAGQWSHRWDDWSGPDCKGWWIGLTLGGRTKPWERFWQGNDKMKGKNIFGG